MPIRKPAVKHSNAPAGPPPAWTDDYSPSPQVQKAYQTLNTAPGPLPVDFDDAGVPISSSHNLNYFYNTAASFYSNNASIPGPISHSDDCGTGLAAGSSDPDVSVGSAQDDAPPGYYESLQQCLDSAGSSATSSATLVLWLFRKTQLHIQPVAERFHLGAADHQPLYALKAQPSIRSRSESNTLAVQRRHPVRDVWSGVCMVDAEPTLELARPGAWRVATLTLNAVPASQAVFGRTVEESDIGSRRGNKLRLVWGDRVTLGKLGDAYGLWWESGKDGGTPEAFFVCEGWSGFDSKAAGIVRAKAPVECSDGGYDDPRYSSQDLAAVYFYSNGTMPPRFVCDDMGTHVRMDLIMSGLMAVMVVETRKASLVKERGQLPAYDSLPRWNSKAAENGDKDVDFGR